MKRKRHSTYFGTLFILFKRVTNPRYCLFFNNYLFGMMVYLNRNKVRIFCQIFNILSDLNVVKNLLFRRYLFRHSIEDIFHK